ncbi:nucleolar protein 56-like [Pongo pygmaeus]|nr:nucleolar protein 56-like [Pongo pygmaeus]
MENRCKVKVPQPVKELRGVLNAATTLSKTREILRGKCFQLTSPTGNEPSRLSRTPRKRSRDGHLGCPDPLAASVARSLRSSSAFAAAAAVSKLEPQRPQDEIHAGFQPRCRPRGWRGLGDRACEETSEKPKKKKKQKPQEVPQENGMEDPSISFSKPKKKKSFSKEELMGSDLEETAGSTSLPKRKKSSPKEETVNDPEEAGPRSGFKKKRKFSKEELVSSGPEEAAGKSSSKKKKKFHKASQED